MHIRQCRSPSKWQMWTTKTRSLIGNSTRLMFKKMCVKIENVPSYILSFWFVCMFVFNVPSTFFTHIEMLSYKWYIANSNICLVVKVVEVKDVLLYQRLQRHMTTGFNVTSQIPITLFNVKHWRRSKLYLCLHIGLDKYMARAGLQFITSRLQNKHSNHRTTMTSLTFNWVLYCEGKMKFGIKIVSFKS